MTIAATPSVWEREWKWDADKHKRAYVRCKAFFRDVCHFCYDRYTRLLHCKWKMILSLWRKHTSGPAAKPVAAVCTCRAYHRIGCHIFFYNYTQTPFPQSMRNKNSNSITWIALCNGLRLMATMEARKQQQHEKKRRRDKQKSNKYKYFTRRSIYSSAKEMAIPLANTNQHRTYTQKLTQHRMITKSEMKRKKRHLLVFMVRKEHKLPIWKKHKRRCEPNRKYGIIWNVA